MSTEESEAGEDYSRAGYERAMLRIGAEFEADSHGPEAGTRAVEARTALVDGMVRRFWEAAAGAQPGLRAGVSVMAVGGYGRRELLPYSDVDLLVLHGDGVGEEDLREPVRAMTQELWDCGLRAATMTRGAEECERFAAENVEFTLSLMDARYVAGDEDLAARVFGKAFPRMLNRERKKIAARLREVTGARHKRFGQTIFHLEPDIKECPGGLRDVHVCQWLARLTGARAREGDAGFREARAFLLHVRGFLHVRQRRDDNTLNWQAQDECAAVGLGVAVRGGAEAGVDPAYWMRVYFRHARTVDRNVDGAAGRALEQGEGGKRRRGGGGVVEALGAGGGAGAQVNLVEGGERLALWPAAGSEDPADDPEAVLALFAAVAQSGLRVSGETEQRLEGSLPVIAANLEDGPWLWGHLERILSGGHAGLALRTMHALGILELLVPEFHGIDALVIRDAYHRYTVDEHTFLLLDTLHGLRTVGKGRGRTAGAEEDVWRARLGSVLRDLSHPGLLYLAALLHDTGKGHTTQDHAAESERMAAGVVRRLELDAYEAGLVLRTVRDHLEMSAALRRDVFDEETVRAFAARVPTPEALRMLTLFTYADICAVNPDALTPWKAENLWRLYMATANFLDRHVDDERVGSANERASGELIHRVAALLPGRRVELDGFLEGLPHRYLLTRTPEQVRRHFEMAKRVGTGAEFDFRYGVGTSELTLVTRDRPGLFARVAGALAAWGMNIVTADGFSNREGVVVDSFRFTDPFRTLELNESERVRFVETLQEATAGAGGTIASMLASRRRARRRTPKVTVPTRVDFDGTASTHSTLLQVIAQDTAGLLLALSVAMTSAGCNIEVALVDTEGEMAIDVFYITRGGEKLGEAEQGGLRRMLLEAVAENAQ